MSPELRRSRIRYLGGCWILATFHLIKAVWLERGGLVGKELAAQPKGLNSDPWHRVKSRDRGTCLGSQCWEGRHRRIQGLFTHAWGPVLERQLQEDLLDSLASQSSQSETSSFSKRSFLKK